MAILADREKILVHPKPSRNVFPDPLERSTNDSAITHPNVLSNDTFTKMSRSSTQQKSRKVGSQSIRNWLRSWEGLAKQER